VNANTTGPGSPATPATDPPSRSAAAVAAASSPHATSRCASLRRPAPSVVRTSDGDTAGSAPAVCAASSRKAAGRRAESGTTHGAGSGGGTATGGASRITWAFVPPTPSAVTPARRGPATGHGVAAVGRVSGPSPSRSAGFGVRRFACGGTVPCRSASTALNRPAIPAQLSRCPMFALTEPISTGSARSPYTERSASTSIGSPSAVPVPCAST
jgi:hypothetical protein